MVWNFSFFTSASYVPTAKTFKFALEWFMDCFATTIMFLPSGKPISFAYSKNFLFPISVLSLAAASFASIILS